MRVIFVNPPSPFLIQDRGAPALGILYLAAILRQHDYEVACWDLTGDARLADLFGGAQVLTQDRSLLLGAAKAIPGEFFGGGETLWAITATSAQYHEAVNLRHAITVRAPHAKVIIGGSHVSALPDEALRDGFHAVIVGEADDFLVDWLDQGGPVGIHHSTAPRDLDRLPFPARDLIDLGSYCANLTVGEGAATTIHASRGCPWQCAYCLRELGDKARIYRPRSVVNVIAELDEIYETYGIRRFTFTDDVFGLRRPWLQEFCTQVKDHGYHFRCNIRTNYLYHECLPAMYEAGFRAISFGVESADDGILEYISKNTVALNTKAILACREAGIAAKCYFLWGLPGDGRDSAEKLKRFVEDVRPDSAQVATLIPLPATPLFRQATAMGFVPDYSQLYHNGKNGKSGDLWLPWWTEETLALRDELLAWIEGHYAQPQPAVQCPNALSATEA